MTACMPTSHSPEKRAKNARGFTLIELMIVVVIIGVLAAIAYPSYQGYARKTKRTDAKSALTALANLQEKFYNQCYKYTSSITGTFPLSGGDSCKDDATPGLGGVTDSPDKLYTLSATVGDPPTNFELKATAKAGTSQASDTGCTELTVNSAGVKSPSNCW